MKYKFLPFSEAPKTKAVTEAGAFTGYGSVFGVVDLGRDVVMAGAFADSLEKRAPKLLWHHSTSDPIGSIEAKEDTHGLFIAAQLVLGVQRAAEALELMRADVVTGLSIGYTVKREEWDREENIYRLMELDLFEVSLVPFPMLPEAQVSRSRFSTETGTKRDLERLLSRDCGLTESHAKKLISGGWSAMIGRDDDRAILDALRSTSLKV